MRRLLLGLALLGCYGSDDRDADEILIRDARGASNRALAAHDTTATASFFLPDYISVSSSNIRSVGRDSARARYAMLFKTRSDVVFVRTAESVIVNREWNQAAESGHWTGRWTQPDGLTLVAGPYFAKWRKVDGRWMLLTEVFAQTTCSGSAYCTSPP